MPRFQPLARCPGLRSEGTSPQCDQVQTLKNLIFFRRQKCHTLSVAGTIPVSVWNLERLWIAESWSLKRWIQQWMMMWCSCSAQSRASCWSSCVCTPSDTRGILLSWGSVLVFFGVCVCRWWCWCPKLWSFFVCTADASRYAHPHMLIYVAGMCRPFPWRWSLMSFRWHAWRGRCPTGAVSMTACLRAYGAYGINTIWCAACVFYWLC